MVAAAARFVLDASVTMAWFLSGESSAYADRALARLREGGALVPPLWTLEVANALLVGERRGRLSRAEADRCLVHLAALPITPDRDTPAHAALLGLGRDHGLSAYDAAYLELALRLALPLATLDGPLAKAAAASGITTAV